MSAVPFEEQRFFPENLEKTYPKIRGCKSVRGRHSRRRSGVGIEGVDVGQQCGHDRGHARAQVLGGQAVEMTEGKKHTFNTYKYTKRMGYLRDPFMVQSKNVLKQFAGIQAKK